MNLVTKSNLATIETFVGLKNERASMINNGIDVDTEVKARAITSELSRNNLEYNYKVAKALVDLNASALMSQEMYAVLAATFGLLHTALNQQDTEGVMGCLNLMEGLLASMSPRTPDQAMNKIDNEVYQCQQTSQS
jgi:hypothetical protein